MPQISNLSEEAKAELRLLEVDGELHTEAVLESAKRPESALHGYYNWDVKHAAKQHWLKVTRDIIQGYRVQFINASDVSRMIPGYVSVRSREDETTPSRQFYVRTEVALSEPELREQLLAGLRREIKNLRDKYGHLKEYREVLEQEISTT